MLISEIEPLTRQIITYKGSFKYTIEDINFNVNLKDQIVNNVTLQGIKPEIDNCFNSKIFTGNFSMNTILDWLWGFE